MTDSKVNTGSQLSTPHSKSPAGSTGPVVERSIASMTRGATRVPYRGVDKNNDWRAARASEISLKRLLNLGLTPENGHRRHGDTGIAQ